MKDGIIKGTGNSRFLKSAIAQATTWEQFRDALIAGTLPIDLNGINEEGWQQLADALNKANLLPDDVATALGLTQFNPQIKDALLATLDKVGDVKCTVRTDMGDKWLLCNGANISGADYPSLTQLLPKIINNDVYTSSQPMQTNGTVSPLFLENNFLIYFAANQARTKTYIVYRHIDDTTWATTEMTTYVSASDVAITRIRWMGDRFLMFRPNTLGIDDGVASGTVTFKSSTNLSTWSDFKITYSFPTNWGKSTLYVRDVSFGGGMYAIACMTANNYDWCVAVASSVGGVYAVNEDWQSFGRWAYDGITLSYANDAFYALGCASGSATASVAAIGVCRITSPGVGSQYSIKIGHSYAYIASRMVYADGKYFFADKEGYINYITSPTSTSSTAIATSGRNTEISLTYVPRIGVVAFQDDINSNCAINIIDPSTANILKSTPTSFTVRGGVATEKGVVFLTSMGEIITMDSYYVYTLPTITTDGSYNYIKAKE